MADQLPLFKRPTKPVRTPVAAPPTAHAPVRVLDRLAQAVAAKERGMANAAAGADPAWLELAEQWVRQVAGSKEDFTTDDVWLAGCPKPAEPRAMGPVMNRLGRSGFIVKVGYRPSVSRNCAPMVVWRKK